MVRQGRLIAVVRAFLIGCVVLLLVVVGCTGTRSEAPKEQGHTEATKEQRHTEASTTEQEHTEATNNEREHTEATTNEQERTPEATESEEARCEGTMTYHSYTIFYRKGGMVDKTGSEEDMKKAEKKARHIAKRENLGAVKVKVWGDFTTNDLPGCPKGGLLLGTDKADELSGEKGDDEIRGLGGNDGLQGGPGSDILYGGEGDDFLDHGDYRDEGDSEDVFYGGDGNDQLNAEGGPRAKLYCGEGRDDYAADKDDYVDSSCEKKVQFGGRA